ncbi:MAG: DNA-directed RNA polymerase subunit alpha [Candidatus Levybacteria bacterium]|nr:DNA-directed RNA polymerase subunit alpha [Candidatus Levybacteria bacterium]
MQDIDFKVKEITGSNDYAEFFIEPLEPGFGHTMGNALRRALYTAIPGAAVTSIKIAGVKHKFSTIPGLRENVIDFLLNIKSLNFMLSEAKTSAVVRLQAKGSKEITASDLELPDGVEIVNKDHYLGSLYGTKAKLDVEMVLQRGYGYALAEEINVETIGVIPTDAVFTPIRRVVFAVESTRVGRKTNLDRLVLKIWTNGTILPKVALDEAARILSVSFTQIFEPKEAKSADTAVSPSVPEELLRLTIDELDLPTRIYNSLRNGGIETISELTKTPKKDLIALRNMGGKSIGVIEEKLREKGISLSL